MKAMMTLLFVAGLVVSAVAADTKDDKLEGKWKIVSVERDGKTDAKWTDGVRTMKDGKFSISVLENRKNAEGQFLSVAFVISFWNQENGELQRTEAQHQTWTRVGTFDLRSGVDAATLGLGMLVIGLFGPRTRRIR